MTPVNPLEEILSGDFGNYQFSKTNVFETSLTACSLYKEYPLNRNNSVYSAGFKLGPRFLASNRRGLFYAFKKLHRLCEFQPFERAVG